MTTSPKGIALWVVVALVVGLVGVGAGYLIRDSFAGVDLELAAARVTVPREPIALSPETRQRVRIASVIHAFLEPRVTWPYRDVLVANTFKRHHLGDIIELLPKLDEEHRQMAAMYNEQKPTIEAVLNGTPFDQEVLLTILSQKSERWAQAFQGQDLFQAFQAQRMETARTLLRGFEADLRQIDSALETSRILREELVRLYAEGPPDPAPVVGDEIPEVIFSLIFVNPGTTDGLMLSHATVSAGDSEATLVRYNDAAGRRERRVEFLKVGAHGTADIRFVFDHDRSEVAQMKTIYERIVADEGPFTFAMEDVHGERLQIRLSSLAQGPS